MKFINKILLSALVVLVPLVSCNTDELQELNVNPQAFDEINLNFLFTAAQLGSASGGSSGDNRFIDWRMNIGFCGHMVQQIANAGGGIAPGDKYFNGEDGAWDFLWSDVGKNLGEIMKQTGAEGFAEGRNSNLRAATRILRVFNFHRLTDYYGNIPYTEAFQGIDGLVFPIYDTQQAIYLDMLNELDEATAALQPLDPNSTDDNDFASSDIFTSGPVDSFWAGNDVKWRRWGYSLMLRLAMRISNVDPATADTYVARAIAGGVMQSNDDNAWVQLDLGPSEWTNQNGISRAFAAGDGGQPSFLAERFVNHLQSTSDPRLMIFSGGTNGDMDPANQVGLPNGLDASTVKTFLGVSPSTPVVMNENFAIINPLLLDDNDPYQIMNYAESEFLLAEAAERGIGGATNAAGHYAAGVRAAMQMYTPFDASFEVSDADVDAYLVANPYVAGATGLEMIGTELWISKFFNWWEAWSDWRRTELPALTPVNYSGEMGTNVTNGRIPRKMRIPNNEVSTNPNYTGGEGAGANLPNEITTRVWWDGGN